MQKRSSRKEVFQAMTRPETLRRVERWAWVKLRAGK